VLEKARRFVVDRGVVSRRWGGESWSSELMVGDGSEIAGSRVFPIIVTRMGSTSTTFNVGLGSCVLASSSKDVSI